jgi:hypothetical protein
MMWVNASRRRGDHGVVPFDRDRLEGAVGSLVGAAVLVGSAVVSDTFGGDGIFAASVRSRCGAAGERSDNSAMSSCEKEPTRRFGLLTGDVGGGGGGLFEFSWRRHWVKESRQFRERGADVVLGLCHVNAWHEPRLKGKKDGSLS